MIRKKKISGIVERDLELKLLDKKVSRDLPCLGLGAVDSGFTLVMIRKLFPGFAD